MRLSIILGTRPEIIKLSPVIRECEKVGVEYFVLHTGQHYSYYMDRVFFEQLGLPSPLFNLEVGSGTHAEQTGKMLIGIEKVLRKEKPDVVLVQGDTNTVIAGVLAAAKMGIRVGHVEAGLRSYDRTMPEEINRVVADHCSDFLFAPTKDCKMILLSEGIPECKTFVTGNTIVDAVNQNLKASRERVDVLKSMELLKRNYFLATVHRQENVENEKNLRGILQGLKAAKQRFGCDIIYPVHPRAKRQIMAFGISEEDIMFIEPVDYLSFLQLENGAKLVLTDSGGVQEESCILKVPCVTLRYNTERPETLKVGSNVLAGTDPFEIVKSAEFMLARKEGWANPFGDGRAGERILNILKDYFDKGTSISS